MPHNGHLSSPANQRHDSGYNDLNTATLCSEVNGGPIMMRLAVASTVNSASPCPAQELYRSLAQVSLAFAQSWYQAHLELDLFGLRIQN